MGKYTKAMKFTDSLIIHVGCEKYELILDTEHKKSFVGTMLLQYADNPMEYGTLDKWCAGHGIEYTRKISYRKDQGILWNLREAVRALWARWS